MLPSYFFRKYNYCVLYMFVLSERQEGLHASLNVTLTETAFHGLEEWSTTLDSFTGAQQYTGCSVIDYGSSNIVGDNVKNSSLVSWNIPYPRWGGGQNKPITSIPKHYAGSSLVEYTISKAGGHNTAETSSAQPFAGSCLMKYAILKVGEQKQSLTSSPRENIWSCDIHNKHYLNSFQYETHLKQAHQGNYKCTSCGKSYVNKYGLDQHIRTVHLGQGFMCPVPMCMKQFTTHRGHDLYASKHSEPEKFRCDNCNYVCQDKDLLRTHTMEHSTTRRYPCSYCTKHFGRSNDCKQHEPKCLAVMETGSKNVTLVSKLADMKSRKQNFYYS